MIEGLYSVLGVVLVLYFLLTYIYARHKKKVALLDHIPGDNQFFIPSINNLLPAWLPLNRVHNDPGTIITPSKMHSEHGSIFKACLFPIYLISIKDLDFIKYIIRHPKEFNKDKLGFIEAMNAELGLNVLSASEHHDWIRHRQLLSPAFTDQSVACAWGATVEACSEWFKMIDANNIRDVLEDSSNLTLEVIGKAGFGYDFDSFHAGMDPNSFKSRVAFLMPRVHIFCLIPKFIRNYLSFGWVAKVARDVTYFKQEINNVIEKRRQLIQAGENNSRDILSLLLSGAESVDGHAPLTDRELGSNVFIFLLAGHETTASSLTFTLYWLCKCKDVQEKAIQIVDEVLGGKSPEYQDIEKLSYLEYIVKESMRMSPVVPMTSRTNKVPVTYNGYTIPSGSVILVQLSAFHRDPQYFDNPDSFIPERWANDLKNPLAYIPFGFGQRSCIGRRFAIIELIISLCMVLQRYTVSFVDPEYGDMVTNSAITAKPAKQLFLKFDKRMNNGCI